jgi:hypothetical protein
VVLVGGQTSNCLRFAMGPSDLTANRRESVFAPQGKDHAVVVREKMRAPPDIQLTPF